MAENSLDYQIESSEHSFLLTATQHEPLILPLRMRKTLERLMQGRSISQTYLERHREEPGTNLSDTFFMAERLKKYNYLPGGVAQKHLKMATGWTPSFRVPLKAKELKEAFVYFIIVAGLGLAFPTWAKASLAPFLSLGTYGYKLSLLFFLLSVTICNFISTLIEIVFHVFTTGFFPRLRMGLTWHGPVIKVQAGYFLLESLWPRILMQFAIQVFPLLCAQILYRQINNSWTRSFYLISVLLTFVYFNPYSSHIYRRLIQWLFGEEEVRHFQPYLRTKSLSIFNKDVVSKKFNLQLTLFSAYAIGWSFFCFEVVHQILNANFGIWLNKVSLGSEIEKFNLIFIELGFVIAFGFLFFDLNRSLFGNVIDPVWRRLQDGQRQRKTQNQRASANSAEVLKKVPLFREISKETLHKLGAMVPVQKFRAGAPILIQGELGKEMFVLLRGEARVFKRLGSGYQESVAELQPGSIFGEVALFENSKRTATVTALTDCEVAKIDRIILQKVFTEKDLEFIKTHIRISSVLVSNSLFKDVPDEVVSLFFNRAIFEEVSPGQILTKEGDQGEDFYLILKGEFNVSHLGNTLATLRDGDFFGEMALLEEKPRAATVQALTKAEVLRLHRKEFWEIVERNLLLAVHIENASLERKVLLHAH